MQMMIDPEKQVTEIVIPINTRRGRGRLRELAEELEDGVILSIDVSEVRSDGQKDG